jgi:uncharacterized membrane protein YfcA
MADGALGQVLSAGSGWYVYILFGVAGGFFSALLGIGGGVVLVPLLVLFAMFPQKLAQGTALGYMVGTCAVGALRYHYGTEGARLSLTVILMLTVGGMLGALLGSWLADKMSQAWLQRLFAIVMLIAAYKMVMKSFETPEPKSGETAVTTPHETGSGDVKDSS